MSELPPSGDVPATGPETRPEQNVALIPRVAWPRVMTPGLKHLVEVNLSWINEVSDNPLEWPFPEEELAFPCSLADNWDKVDIWAVNDPNVVVHRFGGSYGPAEFIAVPHADITASFDHYLQLTFFNSYGVPIFSHDLEFTVSAPERPTGSPPVRIIPGNVIPPNPHPQS